MPVLRDQRVGIGADGVERDVAEVEQAGESDHDVEAPSKHHIDQDLDAEIVDPFQAALRSHKRQRDQRIDEEESECEWRDPARRQRAPAGGGGRRLPRPRGATLQPGCNDQRLQKAHAGDDGDQSKQQRPARFEHELVADVLNGLEPDQRQEEAEGDQAGQRCGAQRMHKIGTRGGRYRLVRHVRPSRLPAGRGCPAAGKSW